MKMKTHLEISNELERRYGRTKWWKKYSSLSYGEMAHQTDVPETARAELEQAETDWFAEEEQQ